MFREGGYETRTPEVLEAVKVLEVLEVRTAFPRAP